MADIKIKSLKSFIILRWPTNVYRRAHSQLATATFFIIVATWSMPGRAQSSVFPKQTNTRVEQVAQLVAEGVTALQRDDVSAAQRLFQQAVALSPNDVTAWGSAPGKGSRILGSAEGAKYTRVVRKRL